MAPLEKAKTMKHNAGLMAARLVVILWAALQAGAAFPASPEAESSQGSAVGKQKKAQTNRVQKSSEGKARPPKRAQPEIREARDETVLCDGVPFGPAGTPAAEGGRQR